MRMFLKDPVRRSPLVTLEVIEKPLFDSRVERIERVELERGVFQTMCGAGFCATPRVSKQRLVLQGGIFGCRPICGLRSRARTVL